MSDTLTTGPCTYTTTGEPCGQPGDRIEGTHTIFRCSVHSAPE